MEVPDLARVDRKEERCRERKGHPDHRTQVYRVSGPTILLQYLTTSIQGGFVPRTR